MNRRRRLHRSSRRAYFLLHTYQHTHKYILYMSTSRPERKHTKPKSVTRSSPLRFSHTVWAKNPHNRDGDHIIYITSDV